MIDDLPDLDAAGLLARASEAVQARRRGEVHDLQVLAQWAAVHSSDPTEGPDGATAPTPQCGEGRYTWPTPHGSASSSTTPAPTASTPKKRG